MSAKTEAPPTTPGQKVLRARGRAALWMGLAVLAAMVARLVFSERRDFDAFAFAPCEAAGPMACLGGRPADVRAD